MALAAHDLGELEPAVEGRVARLSHERVVERIWRRDHTVWRDDPTEISNRLGWLDAPATSRRMSRDLDRLAAEIVAEDVTDVVLLGMGGSSLASEVLARTFGTHSGVRFTVLDTTHPDAIADLERHVDIEGALFVVASKSGTTIETRSHMSYFLDRAGDPSRFVAITDPGTPLAEEASRVGFREVFRPPPDVGGRFSALTPFGLVPAALLGVPLDRLLDGAVTAADACRDGDAAENLGAWLGAALGEAVLAGRDKVTISAGAPTSPASLGVWAEQLFAESTGKEGTGIVPVDGESPGPPEAYGDDRLFLSLGSSIGLAPEIVLPYVEPEQLGEAFFTLEFATAVSGHVLGINPFDQPNVQEAKDRTAEALGADEVPHEPFMALNELLGTVRRGDYVAIQAFVPPRADEVTRLASVRARIRDHFRVATTLGLGPRFLHSTGQLHKGGPDTGVFVQVVADPSEDRPVPGESFTFGRLIRAQAAGDLAALRTRGRRAGRVRIEDLLSWSA